MAPVVRIAAPLRRCVRLLGPTCWALTPFSLVVQVLVAGAWTPAYSVRSNTISELGLRALSPRHGLMNASLVALGLLTAVGAMGCRHHWPARGPVWIGLGCLVLAGIGKALLGIAPGDVSPATHRLGALFQFHGALGLVLVGLSTSRDRRRERCLSLIGGTLASFACLLCGAESYSLIGIGLTQRLAFDTQTAWTGVMGMSLARRWWRLAVP